MTAAQRWRQALEALAIPDAVLQAAPQSPFGFPVQRFAEAADSAMARTSPSPSDRRAAEALPDGGSVLDVGCGAGAASLPLAERAGVLVGVDEHSGMLEAFASRAAQRGVRHEVLTGRWPDVASAAPVVDLVVCHHVTYNVPDLAEFVDALTRHANWRVVVEMTGEHPLSWTAPLWRVLHGLDRPPGPTATDAIAVLRECGLPVAVHRWAKPYRLAGSSTDDIVAFLRRRLCVGEERDADIRDALCAYPPPEEHEMLTLWWDGVGR